MQRARIDKANISDQDKHLILHDNAAQLFGLGQGEVEVWTKEVVENERKRQNNCIEANIT